jgi:PAS domain S-box-containing protein
VLAPIVSQGPFGLTSPAYQAKIGALLAPMARDDALNPFEQSGSKHVGLLRTYSGLVDVLPHGICLLWEPELIWLHVVSDALIATAYFSIPFALAIFVSKRRDLRFGWVYWAFGIFILACGLTHVLSIYTLWVPIYGVEGLVKAATAVASIVTAGMLWPLLPKLLSIPSAFELRQAQAALQEEEIKGRGAEQLLAQFRETQRALRESMARLTAVVETAVDGFILIDARGRILLFNPACERLFGYRADEVFHENVKLLMPPAYRSHHDGYVKNFLQTGDRKIIGIGREVVGLRKDGSTFPMDLSVGKARQDGESIFVGIIHDLTGRKQTEQQLQQAQKMEIVGQPSGGIAHDFNNLLTVIVGNAEHLGEQLESRQDLRHVADDICQAGERGAELTQRLLAPAMHGRP